MTESDDYFTPGAVQPIQFEIIHDSDNPNSITYRAFYTDPYLEHIKENLPEILEKLDVTFEEFVEALQNELKESVARSMRRSNWFLGSLNKE